VDISKKAPFLAYKGNEPFIFASYAHKNSDIVYPYLAQLHDLGYRIWFDEGIEPGTEWPEAIAEAIEECACMVTFISPEAVDSVNVRNEINFALNKKKKMLCVHVKPTSLPRGLELQLGSIQAIMEHKIGSKERFRDQMIASLPAETKEELKKEVIPSLNSPIMQSQQQVAQRNVRLWRYLLSVFCIVIVGIIVVYFSTRALPAAGDPRTSVQNTMISSGAPGSETTNVTMPSATVETPSVIQLFNIAVPDGTTLKNGSKYKLTASSDSGYVLFADVSQLDTTMHSIPLVETINGFYEAEAEISYVNGCEDGKKTLTLYAKSETGVIASKQVTIELKNGFQSDIIPMSDNFNESALDLSKWNMPKDYKLQEHMLLITAAPGGKDGITSRWQFIGDFDIQVDYKLNEGWIQQVSGKLDGGFLGVEIGNSWYEIDRQYGKTDRLYADGKYIDLPENAPLQGKQRIIRSGNTIIIFSDWGNGWVELAREQVDGGNQYASVALLNMCGDGENSFSSYFDNFIVNHGKSNYKSN
jgi:hypothetical protein